MRLPNIRTRYSSVSYCLHPLSTSACLINEFIWLIHKWQYEYLYITGFLPKYPSVHLWNGPPSEDSGDSSSEVLVPILFWQLDPAWLLLLLYYCSKSAYRNWWQRNLTLVDVSFYIWPALTLLFNVVTSLSASTEKANSRWGYVLGARGQQFFFHSMLSFRYGKKPNGLQWLNILCFYFTTLLHYPLISSVYDKFQLLNPNQRYQILGNGVANDVGRGFHDRFVNMNVMLSFLSCRRRPRLSLFGKLQNKNLLLLTMPLCFLDALETKWDLLLIYMAISVHAS